jgi:hypothetical protein
MPATLHERAEVLLEELPPFMQGSYDIQGALHAVAEEIDLLETTIATLRDSFWPDRDLSNLDIFERLLGLSVNPPDKSDAQRQASVIAFYRKLKSSGAGSEWEQTMTDLIGTGWTYEEHDPDDGGSPDAGVLRLTIPFADPIEVPAGFSATPSTASGTLPAATYYYYVSAANFYGETQPTAVQSAVLGSAGHVVLDWNDVTDATAYRVYRGTTSTSLKRLDTGGVITASTYTDDGTATLTDLVSTNTNTTGSFQSREARTLARKITPAHLELEFGFDAGFILGSSELGDFL